MSSNGSNGSNGSNETGSSGSPPIYMSDSDDRKNELRAAINDAYIPTPMFSEFSPSDIQEAHSTITFTRRDCSIIAQLIKGDVYIYSFSCSTVGSGLGKFLLHDVLIYLKRIYPEFAYTTIDPVPQMNPAIWKTLSPADKVTHKATALLKLAGYYKKLGFKDEIDLKDGSYPTLSGDINTILGTIQTMVAKGTRKRRKLKKRIITNKRHKRKSK
jgi:hypothetical protein